MVSRASSSDGLDDSLVSRATSQVTRDHGDSSRGAGGGSKHTRKISSADYVITVSPHSRKTSRNGSSSSLHHFLFDQQAQQLAAATAAAASSCTSAGYSDDPDIELGGSAASAAAAARASPRRASSNGRVQFMSPPADLPRPARSAPAPVPGRQRGASPAAAGGAAAAAAAAARATSAAAAAAAAGGGARELLQPLLLPAPPDGGDAEAAAAGAGDAADAGDDPFPATTAARAAAAQVTRYRALKRSATQLRTALMGQAAAAASAGEAASAAARFQQQLSVAYGLSWVVNILLLVAKLYAYWLSSSKAVLASAADSAVDLVSQMVIAYADWRMRVEDSRFPVGQARLEAIGVLGCACIMSVASFEVIQESVMVLLHTLRTGELPVLELGLVMYVVLGAATLLKLVCWAVCAALQAKSDSMLALAEDHLNDIMSNMCAILTAVAAGFVPNGWYIDPAGAIAISLYIVLRWLAIAKQQVDKLVGRGAPAAFVAQLEELASSHHEAMGLDVLRAYHYGARYIVEMEVVLPATMTVRESHDISLDLQHKVEQLEEVERAFVHVDYTRRDGLEHKVERELAIARALSSSSSGRLATPDGAPSGGGGGDDALAGSDWP